ncbi:hypothetical protein [Pseudorhodobacter sp.]|uniref:hypothetical protein n=1 Tax=Pseudorhodobacter sp. TaxID=1934400 RepID=UPI0039E36CA0
MKRLRRWPQNKADQRGWPKWVTLVGRPLCDNVKKQRLLLTRAAAFKPAEQQ